MKERCSSGSSAKTPEKIAGGKKQKKVAAARQVSKNHKNQ
jgi:hypothetical protein